MPSSSRSSGPAATSRIFALHAQLTLGEPVDAVRLARTLEISARTVKRDIKRLLLCHGLSRD